MFKKYKKKFYNKKFLQIIIVVLVIYCFLLYIWTRGGLDQRMLDTDFGRDLYELSNIWLGRFVWLGPRLGPGLHASSVYYYIFYPFLFFGKGDAHAVVIGNIVIATIALGFFSFLSIRKWGITAIFATLAIGLSPWWRDIVLHPGNGFTYAFFIFASISFLWFNVPKILSSLSIGTALSIHPASIFGLPFFIYEWIRQKVSFKSLLLNFCSFLIPFTPLIAFEIITKGYIIRHWLERPASGISFGLSLDNVNHVFNMSGFSPFLWIPFIFFVLYKTTNQTKMWTIITLILLIIISFFEYFSAHYLFPFSVFISFVTVIALMQNRLGKLILIILVALFLHRIFFIEPFPPSSNRSILKVDTIVEKLHEQNLYNKSTPLAIVAVMDREVHVPQADDYHFFYRIDGYNALDISNYPKAEKLIIFVEDPTFDWKSWSSWEVDQFGSKTLEKIVEIDGTQAILYTH